MAKHRKTSLRVILFCLLLLWFARPPVFAQLGPKDGADLAPTELERVKVGQPAPDFTLEDMEGSKITLSGFRGKKSVVLVFYRGFW